MADVKLQITKTDGTTYDIDNTTGLKSVESLSQSTANPEGIFYGVLSNSGNAEIVDVNKNILNAIRNGEFQNSNLVSKLYINNKQQQQHLTTNSNYNLEGNTLTLQMSNDLSNWESIDYKGFNYPIDDNDPSRTALDILYDIFISTNIYGTQTQVDAILQEPIVYGDTNQEGTIKQYLSTITIPYPYLEADNVKNSIEQICKLAQLQVFKDKNNNIKFVSARPVITPSELDNVLVVKPKDELSVLSESLILKNKYKGVNLSIIKPSSAIDFYSLCGTYSFNDSTSTISTASDTQEGGGLMQIVSHIDVKYYSGTITIPKNRNSSLEQIQKIYSGVDANNNAYIKHSVNYTYKTGDITGIVFTVEGEEPAIHWTTSTDGSGQIANYGSFTYTYGTITANAGQDQTNLKTLSIGTDGNNYIINFKIAVGKEYYGFAKGGIFPQSNCAFAYIPKEVEISIYGDVYIISLEETSISDVDIANKDTIISLDSSELLQEETKLANTKQSDILKSTIKNDYHYGVSTAKIQLACANYYDVENNLVKNYNNGDLIDVRDILRIDKNYNGDSISTYSDGNPKLWRVTGRNITKIGVPKIELQLQEAIIPHEIEFIVDGQIDPSLSSNIYNVLVNPSSTIDYWFTNSGLTELFDFNSQITQDMALYSTVQDAGKLILDEQNCTIAVERTASALANALLVSLNNNDIVFKGDTLRYTITRQSGDATIYAVYNDYLVEEYLVTTANSFTNSINFNLSRFDGDVHIVAKSGTWTRIGEIQIPFSQNSTQINDDTLSNLDPSIPSKLQGRIRYTEYDEGGGTYMTFTEDLDIEFPSSNTWVNPETWTSINGHIVIEFISSGNIFTTKTIADNQATDLTNIATQAIYQIK